MKSIAAVAITDAAFTLHHTLLAGVMVSALVLILGATGLITWAGRLVPDSIIKGVQLGLGLKLAAKGVQMVLYAAEDEPGVYRQWLGVRGLLVAAAAVVYVLLAVVRGARTLAGPCCGDAAPPAAAAAEATPHDLPEVQRSGRHSCSSSIDGPAKPGRARGAAPGAPAVEMGSAELAQGSPEQPLQIQAAAPASSKASSIALSNAQQVGSTGEQRSRGMHLRRLSNLLQNLPAALVLVVLGLALVAADAPEVLRALRLGPATPQIFRPRSGDWWPAFSQGALPQAPVRRTPHDCALLLLCQ